jgi:fatty acid desaturase
VSTFPPGSRRDYADLKRRVRALGLLERSMGRYALDVTFTLTLLGLGAAVVLIAPRLHWQLVGALVLSFSFVHAAYLGHDLGHQKIFRSARAERTMGHLCTLLTGVSYQWWVRKHNQHHAAPNRMGEDPDLEIPFVAFTTAQLRAKSAFGRRLAHHQALLLGPLLVFTSASMQAASIDAVLRGGVRLPGLEALLILSHFAWLYGLFFRAMDPLPALAAVALNQVAFGLHLGLVFATNHIGMPCPTGNDAADFMTRQVSTSRNVTGGAWLDRLFGGLNHQIEHHLFPTIPRHRLREAREIVKPYCEAQAIPYVETGLFSTYSSIVHALRRVADEGEEIRHG